MNCVIRAICSSDHRVQNNYHVINSDYNSGNIAVCSMTRHMTNSSNDVRFEVFTAMTMKNGVSWDVTPCSSCKNRRFGGT
jgi:hypothetical protein